MEELRRSLTALKSQMAQRGDTAAHAAPASEAKAPELSVEEQRAQDRERMQTYMAGVREAFANEKIDTAWATRTSSRVATTFDGDEVLKGFTHSVECRSQTCRVQIEDDGSGKLSSRMPFVAMGLADVLPRIAADHIDNGNSRSTMVLYMSSQASVAPTAAK